MRREVGQEWSGGEDGYWIGRDVEQEWESWRGGKSGEGPVCGCDCGNGGEAGSGAPGVAPKPSPDVQDKPRQSHAKLAPCPGMPISGTVNDILVPVFHVKALPPNTICLESVKHLRLERGGLLQYKVAVADEILLDFSKLGLAVSSPHYSAQSSGRAEDAVQLVLREDFQRLLQEGAVADVGVKVGAIFRAKKAVCFCEGSHGDADLGTYEQWNAAWAICNFVQFWQNLSLGWPVLWFGRGSYLCLSVSLSLALQPPSLSTPTQLPHFMMARKKSDKSKDMFEPYVEADVPDIMLFPELACVVTTKGDETCLDLGCRDVGIRGIDLPRLGGTAASTKVYDQVKEEAFTAKAFQHQVQPQDKEKEGRLLATAWKQKEREKLRNDEEDEDDAIREGLLCGYKKAGCRVVIQRVISNKRTAETNKLKASKKNSNTADTVHPKVEATAMVKLLGLASYSGRDNVPPVHFRRAGTWDGVPLVPPAHFRMMGHPHHKHSSQLPSPAAIASSSPSGRMGSTGLGWSLMHTWNQSDHSLHIFSLPAPRLRHATVEEVDDGDDVSILAARAGRLPTDSDNEDNVEHVLNPEFAHAASAVPTPPPPTVIPDLLDSACAAEMPLPNGKLREAPTVLDAVVALTAL
ncbi:hypothetical protein C8R43DRAFT_944927 [Mycena crocata]|nr:hypothetical protein C8R43DRAFT_944927 [Mycena crocata]